MYCQPHGFSLGVSKFVLIPGFSPEYTFTNSNPSNRSWAKAHILLGSFNPPSLKAGVGDHPNSGYLHEVL